MADAVLQAENLTCIRGDRRLFSDLSVCVHSGELLYLQGANGVGKTTLLRALCGLLYPDEGRISWNGKPIREIGEEFFDHLLYIGHQSAVKSELTPLENLRVSCALGGLYPEDGMLWLALERVGLRGFEDLPVRMLSQGQQRRVSLARLFVNNALLWVLDEPFNALDADAVVVLQEVISSHIDRSGLVVLTTHQEVTLTSAGVRHLRLG